MRGQVPLLEGSFPKDRNCLWALGGFLGGVICLEGTAS